MSRVVALTEENLGRIRALNDIARERGQTLAQIAIAWTLRDPRVTSALIGASSVAQLEENVAAVQRLDFADEEPEGDQAAKSSGDSAVWTSSRGSGQRGS